MRTCGWFGQRSLSVSASVLPAGYISEASLLPGMKIDISSHLSSHWLVDSFAFYFSILTLWALQVQFLLQIIINRVGVLMLDRKRARNLKYGVAILITLINVSVYCIWVRTRVMLDQCFNLTRWQIPARLQTSKTYIKINDVWDRCEKVIYLIVDAILNILFVRVVRRNLVKPGLKKYESLVRFNLYIIGFSLAMDVLIIAMMSLKNSFVYSKSLVLLLESYEYLHERSAVPSTRLYR